MLENTADIIKQISLGEDSVLELKTVKFSLDIVETWLRSICNDLIEPPLDCIIRKMPIPAEDGSEKVIVRVDVPGSLFVHQSPGGYFRRIGSSKRQMRPDVLARLFQQRSQARLIRFDEQIVPNAKLSDLDPGLWKRFRTVISPTNDQGFPTCADRLTISVTC